MAFYWYGKIAEYNCYVGIDVIIEKLMNYLKSQQKENIWME
jgi:hypothetical protein